MQEQVNKAYADWQVDPSPANMSKLLKEMQPLIISQISMYPGDNSMLKGRAKILARDAIKKYDPASGARLTSWVVTQMQPLSRYGRKSNQIVNIPEVAFRQNAELDARRREFLDEEGREPTDEDLADITGISTKRIKTIREMNPAVSAVGTLESVDEEMASPTDFPVQDLEADPLLNTAMEAVYESADDRDRAILDMKTGRSGTGPVSNQEIAMRLGVSPGLVSQRSLELAKQMQDVYGI